MTTWDAFYGPNAGYLLEQYERYQQDPGSVDATLRAFFEQTPPPATLDTAAAITPALPQAAGNVSPAALSPAGINTIVAAARLARSIREYGHLAAHIDPLDTPPPGDPMLDPATHNLTEDDLRALPATIVWPESAVAGQTCLDAIGHLRAIYCGHTGYDFDHVQDFTERAWLRDAVESQVYAQTPSVEQRRALLQRLTEVEEFEHFLHTTFQGQKRFSIEGTDMLVPMLDEVIHAAAEAGAREVLIGMAHRGRLNVLAHVLGKPLKAIFSEFHSAPNKELVPSEGSMGINYGWTGDVKYHLGARRVVHEGELVPIQLTMAHNPSHLEFVNPVIEGNTRAAQDDRTQPGQPRQHADRALAIVVHGDAAFPGEGVVAETLNLSRLPGYETGGTIHIIANNQIGFTTESSAGRSTLYASDLAKGFEIPIIHVNADDVEACLAATQLAFAYRDRFHKDFLIDLVGYRRWGHNEGDEPSFTQPVVYAAIASHPTVRALYAQELVADGVITEQEAEQMRSSRQATLKAAYDSLLAGEDAEQETQLDIAPPITSYSTAVPAERLRELNEALLQRPDGFSPHGRLERLLQRRRERLDQSGGIEWAHAESLAFAAILADGTPIRMSGQDTERGTFSQRHLVLHDTQTGETYTPHQALPQARASFAIYNSPLSEAAVLGFEYGYSVHAREALVLWEAQFGDFANAGQVLIDQFIAAARAKWRQYPSLTLLLPHGYEGQGPEHSSGRLERYLQLAAEDNLRIANCTTAAQYFHLLRAQAKSLTDAPRPLIIMTPKSLLRQPRASSSLKDLAEDGFHPILAEPRPKEERKLVERLIFCTGKVAIDLQQALESKPEMQRRLAIIRVEQLYPFPDEAARAIVTSFPAIQHALWVQEEPRNMGAWAYIQPLIQGVLPRHVTLEYIGRPERASTAEGFAGAHAIEQARIIESALADGNNKDSRNHKKSEKREEQHVS